MQDAFARYVAGGSNRAVAFADLNGPLAAFYHNAETPMPVASMMKVPMAMALYGSAQNLSQTVRVRDLPPTRYCSIWAAFDADHQVTLAELAHVMLIVSDNPAAVWLEKYASCDDVTAFLQASGCSEAAKMAVGFSEDMLGPQGRANVLTAADVVVLWKLLAEHPLYTKIRDVLVHNLRNNRLAAPLDESVKVAHKTGSLAGVACDAALITTGTGREYILVCLSDGEPDMARANADQAALSDAVYKAVMAS